MELELNNPEFVNSIIYPSWSYCFNQQCPRKDDCIHFISSQFIPEDKEWGSAIYPTALHDGKCQHFMRACIVKAAWGLSHLYDEVKHVDAATLKYHVIGLLGGKTMYYRYHRGEKHLSPELQEEVNRLFAEWGYSAPHFDHYKEEVGFVYK